jgi:hypothetical protein
LSDDSILAARGRLIAAEILFRSVTKKWLCGESSVDDFENAKAWLNRAMAELERAQRAREAR